MLYRVPPNKWKDNPYKDPKTGQTTTLGQKLDADRANAPKPRDFSALDNAKVNSTPEQNNSKRKALLDVLNQYKR
jgi:hypothetical protein